MASQTEIPPPVLGLRSCPQCDTRMLLVRILPVSPGYQRRTYECPRCQHELTEVIHYDRPTDVTQVVISFSARQRPRPNKPMRFRQGRRNSPAAFATLAVIGSVQNALGHRLLYLMIGTLVICF